MGIEVVLEDEQGNAIENAIDPTNMLHKILPAPEDGMFRYLNRIDWYGDTTFNRLQMDGLRNELDRLSKTLTASREIELLKRIDEFAARCQSKPHLYVKFYGD